VRNTQTPARAIRRAPAAIPSEAHHRRLDPLEPLVRSYESITPSELQRLADIARSDREDFFQRYPRWSTLYSRRLLWVALCQGAALHFLDGKNGVKDFDVWSFFCEIAGQPIPRRRVVFRDFGQPQFGTSPDKPNFIGRKVDLLFKSIACTPDSSPTHSLQRYLTEGRTDTARCLAQKPVVLLEPIEQVSIVAWQPNGHSRESEREE
jgi:hypothetical protein